MTTTPELAADDLPWIDTDQMREVDRLMIDELHIELMQMMENAGRSLARLALDRFAPSRVVVCVGPGGNGGGGLVAARHLANAGVSVEIARSTSADRFAPVPAHQLDIITRLGLVTVDEPGDPGEPDEPDLWIDAVIGYSLHGDPRARAAVLIGMMNDSPSPVLALDTPSGLDTTTGRAADPAVRATATMTLAAPKTGLRGSALVGELYLADISVPPSLYRRLGVAAPTLGPGAIGRVTGF